VLNVFHGYRLCVCVWRIQTELTPGGIGTTLAADMPKLLDAYLIAEEQRCVERRKSNLFGAWGQMDDPIIVAIEAHRRACVVTRAAFERQSAVEDELRAGAGMREAESDPPWIAAEDAAGAALAVQDGPSRRPSPALPHSSPIMSML
jgi:hypothetical protein